MEDLSKCHLCEIILWLTPFVLLVSFSLRFLLHYEVWLSICFSHCCTAFQQRGRLLRWLFALCQCFPLWRLYLDVWQPNIIAFAEFTDICISWIMSVKMKWWAISMQWREYRPAKRRSYLSAIRYDRLISEILNCKGALILAEMKVVALILSVVNKSNMYFCKSVHLPELFWNQCTVVTYRECMQWSKRKLRAIYLRLLRNWHRGRIHLLTIYAELLIALISHESLKGLCESV